MPYPHVTQFETMDFAANQRVQLERGRRAARVAAGPPPERKHGLWHRLANRQSAPSAECATPN